jgi:tetratricopeptide (TPR) repeat protein
VNPESELRLDILDGLGSLVDSNLVGSMETPESEQRFIMLETIREYGLERLAQSREETAIRRRHVEYWIDVAERVSEALSGPEQAAVTKRLERDLDNFRSALSWALQSREAELGLRLATVLHVFWRLGSHVREGVRWLDDFLALPEGPRNTLPRARALSVAANLAPWMGATEAQLRFAEDAVAAYRELGNPDEMSEPLGSLGWAQLHAGRLGDARANLEEATKRHIEQGERHKAADCNLALGMLSRFEGNPTQAREHLEDALETFKELHDPYWVAFTELLIGQIDRFEGNDDDAEKRYRSSLTASCEHDFLMLATSVLYAFADLALLRGQHERAIRLAGASDALREPFGDKSPLEKASVTDIPAAVRPLMGEATAEAQYQEGLAMKFEEAVAYALHQGA